MYSVSPFGERRQDIRQAFHTAQLMNVNRMGEPQSAEEFSSTVKALSAYLQCDIEQEDFVDLDALERMKRKQERGGDR